MVSFGAQVQAPTSGQRLMWFECLLWPHTGEGEGVGLECYQ